MGIENGKQVNYLERTSRAYSQVSEIVRAMKTLSMTAELTLKPKPQIIAEVSGIALEIIEMACLEAPVNDLKSFRLQLRGSPEIIDFIREHSIVKNEPPKIAKTPENLSLWHPQCRIITHEETILPNLYLETGLLGQEKTPATVYLVGPKWITVGNQQG